MERTCENCMRTRHLRCLSRLNCACTVCAKRRRTPKPPKIEPEPEPIPKVEAKEKPRKGPGQMARSKWPVDKDGYSTNPKAIALRLWRERHREGSVKKYRRTAPDAVDRAIELREQGMTWRAIGAEVGVDYSHLARLVKARLDES